MINDLNESPIFDIGMQNLKSMEFNFPVDAIRTANRKTVHM